MRWSKKVVLFDNQSIELDVLNIKEEDLDPGSMFWTLGLDEFFIRLCKADIELRGFAEYVPEGLL